MGKILGSWSGMRKYLERDMLAETLQGRIRYGCTTYVGMDGCRIFEICIDKQQVKRFSWETVNTYFIENGCTKNPSPSGKSEYWAEFWTLLDKYAIDQRTEYTDDEFCGALEEYRNQDIQNSIYVWSHIDSYIPILFLWESIPPFSSLSPTLMLIGKHPNI